jgi:predicted acyl esterase
VADSPLIDEKDIYVTMRDGVRIALRIYRPQGDGEFPTLFVASPYQYDTDDLPSLPLFLWRETGPVAWYVAHGYAYVRMDVRGAGKSEGVYGYLDRDEQQDCTEVIEWIARQSWSNGKVGGYGQSYYAMIQWLIAAWNTPHLTCIAPYDGFVDPYRGSAYNGGIYAPFFNNWYAGVRANNMLRAANVPNGPGHMPDLPHDALVHATYDAWWKERSAYERLPEITIPVLSIGHWGKIGLHLRGNILGYEQVQGPKKLVVTGMRNTIEAHHLFDTIEFHEKELLPFYDHFLKGIDNGFMDGPPVKLFVRGDNSYRDETAWPPPAAEMVPYYLRAEHSGSVTSLNDGSLSIAPPEASEGSTTYAYPDDEWTSGVVARGPNGLDPVRRVLTFTTPALDLDTEVTGCLVLELHASSDQPDTDFIVKLSDVQPLDDDKRAAGAQPEFSVVSKGWLKASHRRKDEARSSAVRPFHTHADPQPLTPGQVYAFEIEVHPASYVFKAGHRIRLELANGDSNVTDGNFSHQYLWFKQGSDTIYHDADHPSRLLLPVVPR